MNGLHVLDSETDVEEVLEPVSCEATLFAHHLGAVLAIEYGVQQVFLRSGLELLLYSVHEDVEELLRVLLDSCVGRLTIHVLECKAELD